MVMRTFPARVPRLDIPDRLRGVAEPIPTVDHGRDLAGLDANGIESLKMGELAQTLRFEAMALYRHVAGKDEILDGIMDLVLSETEPAQASADWAAAVRRSAISLHEALERHPWATSLLTSPAGIRPARLEHMESLLARLEDAGFSDDGCYHASCSTD
jgi:hypothetical protein